MFLQTYRLGMGREVNGVNAQVEKDLNVDRNRKLTDEYPGRSEGESFKI